MRVKNIPADVGVPDNTPVELNERPAGQSRVGSMVNVYGAVPPAGTSEADIGVPTTPGGIVSGDMPSGLTPIPTDAVAI
jgi:hypothetical protein